MRQNCLRYLLWITCTLWSATAFAQDQRLALDYFGENKGLNITRINDIRQDKTGFLWIATREGLVRYDGHTFKYFRNQPGDTASLSSNHIQCLAEDADGNIWSGLLRGGVSRYDRKSGAFRNYPFTEKLKLKTAPVSGIFFDRDGNLWLGMEPYGLIRLDQKTGDFKQYDLVTAETAPHLNPDALVYSNAAYQFWQDENGIIWCTTRDGLYRFDPKTGRAKPQRAPGFNSKEAEYRQTYTLQPDGDLLWMGGWASGLQCFNRKTGAWKQYFFNSAFGKSGVTNVINHIEPKNADELWVSTMDMGLGIFNKKTERFYFLAHDTDAYPDLPDAQANVFCVDGQGHLWINLNNQLARIQLKDRIFQFNQVRSLRTVPQYQSHISTLFEDREGRFLFIGMFDGDGLHIVDKKTGKVVIPDFPTLPGLERAPRTVMGIHQSPDGTIWVLTRYLICRFNPATMRLEKPVQPPVFVPEYTSNLYNQFSEEPGGNLWLCSSLVGVFRYNPRTGKTVHFMPDENKPGAIATNIVGSIAVDRRGRVWYGSRSKTAYGYYLPEEERFIYLDAQGMVTRELTTLYLSSFYTDDKGDIWACTEQGLLHFDCSGDQPRLLRKYTIADGLRSDFVIGATQDQDGHIWALLVGSLCRLDTGAGKITAFGKRDGFPDAISGIGCLRNGTLYLKSEYGYYTIDPAALVPYRSTAPLVLSSFKVDDREWYHGSQSVPSQPFVIPADSRFFFGRVCSH
jgi:ligand-binding sensor domain-containing protein